MARCAMGDESDKKETRGADLKGLDHELRNRLGGRPVDHPEGSRGDLDEDGTIPDFEWRWDNPREATQDNEIPKTPD